MKAKEIIFLAVVTLYMAYLVIPIFMFVSGLNISTVCIATSVIIFLLYPRFFFNKVAYAGLFYLGILYLYYLAGRNLPSMGAGDNPALTRLIMATAFILPNLAIAFVVNNLNKKYIYRYLTISSLIILLLSFISFTPLILYDVSALRLITIESQSTFVSPLLPHYSLLHAYIMLLPVVLMGFKIKKGLMRWFFLIMSLYILFIIFQSSITTVIVIAVMVVVIMMSYNPYSERKSIVRAIGLIVLLIFLKESGILSFIMDSLVGYYDDSAAGGKMRYFRDLLAGKTESGSSMEVREDLHKISIDSFFANPILGGGKQGGHSCLLDRFGVLGLVGFIPYVIFLYTVFKTTIRQFTLRWYRIVFIIVTFCAFMLLYQKGLFGQECWLFFIVLAPAILHYLELEPSKQ